MRLRDALHKARIEAADRTGVVVDLRDAEVARLEILNEALDPLFAQMPDQIDLFDRGISQGETPRLWIDVVAHVVMGRDKRMYRFVQDTRYGRIVLAESHDVPAIVDAVTDYVARRMVEREHALVAGQAAGRAGRSAEAAAAGSGFSCSASSSARWRCSARALASLKKSRRRSQTGQGIVAWASSTGFLCYAAGRRARRRLRPVRQMAEIAARRIHPHLPLAAWPAGAPGKAPSRPRPKGQRAGVARSAPVLHRLSDERPALRLDAVAGRRRPLARIHSLHPRLRGFCRNAFGGFLHHTPAVVLERASQGATKACGGCGGIAANTRTSIR